MPDLPILHPLPGPSQGVGVLRFARDFNGSAQPTGRVNKIEFWVFLSL